MKYKGEDGELKDIYIKAVDTLPVGTIVEYDLLCLHPLNI